MSKVKCVTEMIPDYDFIRKYYKEKRPGQKDDTNMRAVIELMRTWVQYEICFYPENIEETRVDIEKDGIMWGIKNANRYDAFEDAIKKACSIFNIEGIPHAFTNKSREELNEMP